MAKRFMYVCFGILALLVAYHLGASSAQSQAGTFVSIGGNSRDTAMFLLTDCGDCYMLDMSYSPHRWVYMGNPTGGTPTQSTTWGAIKAEFAE